jgi:phage terminase large subunit GpA-like protein
VLATQDDGWVPVERKYVLDPDYWDDPFPLPPEAVLERPPVIGAHAASWVSAFVPLSKVVAEFLRAHREPDPVLRKALLMAWTNNHPNKPWRELVRAQFDPTAFDRLKDERPAEQVPEWALLLVLTADVQLAGVYFELRAWDGQKRSALVHYGYLSRDVAPAVEWNELPVGFPRAGDCVALREVFRRPYLTAGGVEYLVRFGLVDSGYRTEEVYQFCRAMNHEPANAGRPFWPSKGYEELRGGQNVLQRKVDTFPGTSKPIPGGLMRADVDTNRLKDALAETIDAVVSGKATHDDPGAWLLHRDVGADYVQHYRSEVKDPADQTWKQRGKQPNHWWDCGVLQLAAVWVLDLHGVFARLVEAMRRAATPAAPKPAAPVRQEGKLW